MSPWQLVDLIYRDGTVAQKLALEAVLSYEAQIDWEWGGCQSAEWFRAHPEALDERAVEILRAVVA
jgi:hypothetical protein